jgi:hypothetical protein
MASCRSFIRCSVVLLVQASEGGSVRRRLGSTRLTLGVGRRGPASVCVTSFPSNLTRLANGVITVLGPPVAAGWNAAPPGWCSPDAGSSGASDAPRDPVAGLTCVCVPSYVVITSPVSSADRSTLFLTGHFGFVHR